MGEMARYENIRMFALQSRFDSWQSQCGLGSDHTSPMNEYGRNLSDTFQINYIKGPASRDHLHGAFLDSCSHHCGMWNSFKINGKKVSKVQYDFYHGKNIEDVFWFQEEKYPCDWCCTSSS